MVNTTFSRTTEDFDPFSYPPVGIVFGPINSGKTTEIARSFPDWYWLSTDPTGLRTVAHRKLVDPGGTAGWSLPKKVKVLTDDRDMNGQPVNHWGKIFASFLQDWQVGHSPKLAPERRWPQSGFVISDMTTLSDWIMRDMKGGLNANLDFSKINLTKDLMDQLVQVCRATKTGAILEMQYAHPKYVDKGPNAGKVKWCGGPDWPIGSLIAQMSIPLDFVWEIREVPIEEADPLEIPPENPMPGKTKRVLLTKRSGLVERKTRGDWTVVPPIVDLEQTSMRELLVKLGMKPQNGGSDHG